MEEEKYNTDNGNIENKERGKASRFQKLQWETEGNMRIGTERWMTQNEGKRKE